MERIILIIGSKCRIHALRVRHKFPRDKEDLVQRLRSRESYYDHRNGWRNSAATKTTLQ